MRVTSFEVARLKGSLSCALNPLRARSLSYARNPLLSLSVRLSLYMLSLSVRLLYSGNTHKFKLLYWHYILIKVLPKHLKYVYNTEYIYTTKVIKEIINEYKIRERKNSRQYL